MIYKYCGLNEWTLGSLRRRELIARHYSQFNDPFEFWARVRSGQPDRVKEKERYLAAVRAWGGDEELEKETPEFFESLAEAQPDFVRLYDFTRVMCFASSPSNLLMWSHYADGLRGLCMGFDEDALARNLDAQLVTVRYLDRPPAVDTFLYAVAEDQSEYQQMALAEHRGPEPDPYAPGYKKALADAEALMTEIRVHAFAAKPMEWAYEQEKRLLLFADAGDTASKSIAYSPEALKEIIVGERMPASYKTQVEELLKNGDVRVGIRTAVRAPESYTVLIV
jgi:hypothetical protein